MKAGRQKQKANTYEIAIAKLFTEAYYPTKDGEFRRIPLSGGWDKRVVSGDVVALRYVDKSKKDMAIDESFPLSIECKTWHGVKQFFSGLYSEESALFEWMVQAQEDSIVVKKMPVVVFRLFRTENIAMFISTDFGQLTLQFGNFRGKIYTIEKIMPKEEKTFERKLTFVLLKDFLEWIDWDSFRPGKWEA